ncbi:MAG: hypothetical protein JWO73_311 [Candidatus Taylorbacteria bacterium]|nr:hypothetical protein [Candidatus Taylorbacteria bacterium]
MNSRINAQIIANCRLVMEAFKAGKLGQTRMPEDSNPWFSSRAAPTGKTSAKDCEMRLAYFTLPMALNYQRDSYKLWEAALKTFNDPETRFVFDVAALTKASESEVRAALTKHKVALQPNKHIATWRTIARTIHEHWGSFEKFFDAVDGDFLILKRLVNIDHKKGFPYISGPKIFNYWSFIITTYGGVRLTNRGHIEIAPDTHITQCSVKLGVITALEAEALGKEAVSLRWRELLSESGIDPIDMHPPLWFWSRNGFIFEL